MTMFNPQVTAEKVGSFISTKLSMTEFTVGVEYDFAEITIPKDALLTVLKALKEDESMGFAFLTTICGIHFPEKENKEFWLMYQLHNLYTNERVRIYTCMPKTDLNVPTCTGLWAAANWMEREAFDFYGFQFEGHPELTRILNVEDMDYHPMRKEYQLEDDTRTDKDDSYFGR